MLQKLLLAVCFQILASSAFSQDSLSTVKTSKPIESDIENFITHLRIYPSRFANFVSNQSPLNQYTSSSGFISNSNKGFANSMSYGVSQTSDGADVGSSIFNAPLHDFLTNELDWEKADAKTYSNDNIIGNRIGGVIETKPVDVFQQQQISFQQESGFNQALGLHNKTLFRYGQVYGKKKNIAFHLSGEFDLKREWQFDEDNDTKYAGGNALVNLNSFLRNKQYDTVTPDFTQQDKDKIVALNSWLDFNPVASQFDTAVADGFIHFPVAGYSSNDLMRKYFRNIKANAGLHFKLGKQTELSFAYKFAMFNTVVQPFWRYQLSNYTIHQPKAEIKGKDFFFRAYATIENSGNSYNIQRTGYHLLRGIDSSYIRNYTQNFSDAYFSKLDTLIGTFKECPECFNGTDDWRIDSARNVARRVASQTYYPQKGEPGFDSVFNSITSNGNLSRGSGFKALSKTFYADGEYRFGFQQWLNLALGANYQLITLDNNELKTEGKIFHDAKAYLHASKNFWKERVTVFASGQYNYNTDFGHRGDYRAGVTFAMKDQSLTVSSSSGYTFPTFTQRYAYIKDYEPQFYGGMFERGKRFSYASVLNFENHPRDSSGFYNTGVLKVFGLEKLKPQETKTIELVLKNIIAKRILITTNAYYNWVSNTQALAYLISTQRGDAGADHTSSQYNLAVDDLITGDSYTPFRTWTNLPVKTNSWGVFFNISYVAWHGITPYFNYHYFGHKKITVSDDAIVSFNDFNTPMHKLNLGVEATDVWKGLGFALNFKWVAGYRWQSDFGGNNIPSYHTLDLMIQYHIPKAYSTFRLGASNLYNNRHMEIPFSPRVGSWYYASWRFDFDLSKVK